MRLCVCSYFVSSHTLTKAIYNSQEAVIWYFFCVETVGYTLEELDEIFSAPNPVKASVQKKKVRLHAIAIYQLNAGVTGLMS